jgi:predicted enzyme related to lactoylglutathione lyase
VLVQDESGEVQNLAFVPLDTAHCIMTTNDETSPESGLEHGQLCYLQIPALDIRQSADFYTTVFGWRTDPANSGFEAPGLIGQWVNDRAAAPGAGPLAWINVESIDETLTLVAAEGGKGLEPPSLDDGVRWLATIADPGGNTIGLVQLGPR